MLGQESPLIVPLIVTAAFSVALAAYVVRRTPPRGVPPFVALMAAIGWWSLCYALELASLDLAAKVLWTKLAYIGVVTVPTALLAFVRRYTERRGLLRGGQQVVFALEPLLTLLLLWTNDAHRLVWTDVRLVPYYRSFTTLAIVHGPWFWIHTFYSYCLTAVTLFLLLRALARSSYLYRRQITILLLSVLLPLLGDVVVVSGRSPLGSLDVTPFTTAVAGAVFSFGLLRFRLFDVLPVARETVLELVDEGMVVVNAEGRIVDINAALQRLIGRRAAQVIGQPAAPILSFYDELVQAHPEAQDVRTEIGWATRIGQRHSDLYMTALFDRHGGLAGHLFVLHDITALKEAEAEARQRSRELEMLHDTALAVASQLDLQRLLQAITERAVQLLSASTGDLSLYRPESDDLEAAVLYGISPELGGTVLKRGEGLAGKLLETGKPIAVEDYSTWPGRAPAYDGQPFGPMVGVPLKWGGRVLGTIDVARQTGPAFTAAEVRLLMLFGNQAAVAIENARLYADAQRELAERRAAEKQVRQRSQELATLYETTVGIVAQLDLQQLLPVIVERAARLLRGTGAGMYLYHPATDDLEYVVAHGLSVDFIGHRLQRGEGLCGKVLQSGEPLTVKDYHNWPGRSAIFEGQDTGPVLGVPVRWGERILGVIDLQRDRGARFGDGDIRLLTLFANQAAIALANAQLYAGAQRELAERKQTEAALRESEARYRAVVEDQTELIYRFTPQGVVTFVNEAACRLLGREKQEIIGENVLADVPVEEQAQVWRALTSISPQRPVITIENRVLDGRGRARWLQWTDRGIFDEAGTLMEYQSVGRDVTEQKLAEEESAQLQAQLQQAQRMEAVGVLAGGVAHEFNNLLTVIQGNVELALSDMDAPDPLQETLLTVARSTQRAAMLTKQLLAFSRRQRLQRGALDLNRLIQSFAGMLRPALGPGIELQLDLAAELKPILADGGAIEQVLMNLALNARDAMPDGGVLRIETALVALNEAFCRTRPQLKPGDYVRMTVSDNGIGMDDETLGRIFEPFFTTKGVGKGTGLGLSVMYGIIRQHDGLVEVESKAGEGTRFEVYLPVHEVTSNE